MSNDTKNLSPSYRAPSLANDAYTGVRDMIVSGELPPGALIQERLVTDALGLSRTPVRQGLTQLVSEGLLIRIPRAGVFVRKLDSRERREFLELRRVLEAGAAGMAAERITSSEAAALIASAEELEACPESENIQRNRQLEVAFHLRVVELSGNREMMKSVERTHMICLTLFPDEAEPDFIATRPEEHKRIADAIASGRAMRAYVAMWRHFGRALNR